MSVEDVGGGQRTILPLALGPSRGEFDLDLGAEGAGGHFERRQTQPIVIFSLQARIRVCSVKNPSICDRSDVKFVIQ